MPGLNAKLSEICALMAHLRLKEVGGLVANRGTLMQRYRGRLADLVFQHQPAQAQAHQFAPVLLPAALAVHRDEVQARLKQRGIGVASYFSPHLAEHPHFAEAGRLSQLDVTHDVAARIISLPLFDDMTMEEVDEICDALAQIMDELAGNTPILPPHALSVVRDAADAEFKHVGAATATHRQLKVPANAR